MNIKVSPVGDCAVRLEFGTTIHPGINKRIRQYSESLKRVAIPGVIEVVPAYTTILVYYDPNQILYNELVDNLEKVNSFSDGLSITTSKVYEIPVVYGGRFGIDLSDVASINYLTEQEVIRLHSNPEYLIYMIGFVPGFPYLGGMAEEIAAPRLEKPRAKVEAGSVGIAGKQTGIYPLESPGGWRIIGKTPIELYKPTREIPVAFSAGDYLKFKAITDEEYDEIVKQIKNNCYQIRWWEKVEANED